MPSIASSVFSGLICALACAGAAVAAPVYDLDFDTGPLGPPPVGEGPFPRTTISSIAFGNPEIVAEAGGLDRPLAFDGDAGIGLEQVALEVVDPGLPATEGVEGYRLELDLFLGQLSADPVAPSRFALLLDAPLSHGIRFDGNGDIRLSRPGFDTEVVGSFELGSVFRVVMDLDFDRRTWTTRVGDVLALTVPFPGVLNRVRLSLQNLPDTGVNQVAVDNVRLRSVPEPGALPLLAAGMGWLRGRGRQRR